MNIFDAIQNTAFDVTAVTFGYPASWLPSNNDPEKIAQVHYKDATAKRELDANDYQIEEEFMEYKKGDFDGLFEIVANAGTEKVNITFAENDVREFHVRRCEKLVDGRTIKAFLQPI